MLTKESVLIHEAGWLVDKGEQRYRNEDSSAGVVLNLAGGEHPQPVSIYAVADGIGGHRRGDLASELAVQVATRKMMMAVAGAAFPVGQQFKYWVREAFGAANRAVYAYDNHADMHMGTTLVLALIVANQAYIANVGDSRAYLLSQQGIKLLTRDHSLTEELVRTEVITEQQALNHPYRKVLSRAVGTRPNVDADMFTTVLAEHDYLLLCSDGLTKELDDQSIYQIVYGVPVPQDACEALVAALKTKDRRDNITVVLVQLKSISGEN